jgi:hypothetical protein
MEFESCSDFGNCWLLGRDFRGAEMVELTEGGEALERKDPSPCSEGAGVQLADVSVR